MDQHVVVLIRHGETAWSFSGRHTSRTDVPLTDRGRDQSHALARRLAHRPFAAVLTSPAERATETGRLAGLAGVVDAELAEWDYGDDEGRTTAEIRVDRPGWTIWRDGPKDGETIEQVTARADRVLTSVRALLADGDVALVGHAHLSRVLTARWLGLDTSAGRLFALDTGTVSELGHEREQPVIRTWNVC